MVRQSKAKKAENFGKGKVTPVQIAFIVDRYLSDNNYSQTRSVFRTEASSLISRSPVQEAPKSLLSLGAMLDEYVCLKEQKVMVEQEKLRLEQERSRVHALLQGMQDVMNVYNSSGNTLPPHPVIPAPAARSSLSVPPSDPCIGSSAGYPTQNTPIGTSVAIHSRVSMESRNFSTPVASRPSTIKRKSLKVPDAPPVAKKLCSQSVSKQLPNQGGDAHTQFNDAGSSQQIVEDFAVAQVSPHNRVAHGSLAQGSSVVKSLFNQPCLSPMSNSSGPKTPPQPSSPQSDKSISPLEVSPLANSGRNNTPGEMTTNCTVISSETLQVSPSKQIAYLSMERNHCVLSSSPIKGDLKRLSRRDHVKGRLDFDGSDAPVASEKSTEPERGMEIFDIDLTNLDAFGADFSISELLDDFDFNCEEMNYACPQALGASMESLGLPEPTGADRGFSDFSSMLTEVLSEKDGNIPGPDMLTSVKSTTTCIRILSPAKTRRSPSLDQENLCTVN